MGIALSVTSDSAVRVTYSQGMIALIAVSVAILFPLFLFLVYTIRNKIRRAKRGHRDSHVTSTSLMQTDVENIIANQREDKLIDAADNKDPLE